MTKINANYLDLKKSYLFSDIAKKVNSFIENNPDKPVLKLGIGDVIKPLTSSVVKGLHGAVDEMANDAEFRGYGPEQGYGFLREAIAKVDFKDRGLQISADEIFVSDGAKSDSGNIQGIFSLDAVIAVTDPVYPVYVDTNIMAGRRLVYLECMESNGFVPSLPTEPVDLIYLCFPNNPTGTTLTKSQLKEWVDYAKENKSIIIFDAAYEAFISEKDVPHSIYEIEGAKEVAIEIRSFSKNAGFTGTRLGYTVVPHELKGTGPKGEDVSIRDLWSRRQTTKFNGAPYIIQKGALNVYTDQGQKEIKERVAYYMENAQIIRDGLNAMGIECYGGVNAPYIWLKTPTGLSSWDFFDKLLNDAQVVGTPGAGFGSCGEGYFRLSAFCQKENVIEAIKRIKENLSL
jgi:LL-diaminopimelate aminotransferase